MARLRAVNPKRRLRGFPGRGSAPASGDILVAVAAPPPSHTDPRRPPSHWVVRFAAHVAPGTPVLDVATGGGRHARFFRDRGHPVVAVDRDVSGLADRRDVEVVRADLEDGSPWPLPGRRFGGIVVVDYLHRPLLPLLADLLAPGGVLLYDTFAQGQERIGRPRNPAFLLAPGELLETTRAAGLVLIAWQHAVEPPPAAAVRQRLAARRGDAAGGDGFPTALGSGRRV